MKMKKVARQSMILGIMTCLLYSNTARHPDFADGRQQCWMQHEQGKITNHFIVLANQLCKSGHVRRIVLRQMMSHLTAKSWQSSSSFLTFWNHYKIFCFIKDKQSQQHKFAADRIYLAPRGQYKLLQFALLCVSRSLVE